MSGHSHSTLPMETSNLENRRLDNISRIIHNLPSMHVILAQPLQHFSLWKSHDEPLGQGSQGVQGSHFGWNGQVGSRQVSVVSMLSPAQIPDWQTLSLWLVVVQELQLPQVPSWNLWVGGVGDSVA